jgi:CRISPR-associated endonuclease Cas1
MITETVTSPAAAIFAHDPTNASVLVVDGYGLEILVTRGHLIIRDGLGRHRRERQLPRAQRTVQRILILGHTGHITLEAIRWCHDTGIAIVHLDSNGTLLLTAGKTGVNDARLRRAQAAAATSHVGLNIARELLGAKIDGQAAVASTMLDAQPVADLITRTREQLNEIIDLVQCRGLEAQASNSYFGAWSNLVTCRFAARDADRVPAHWSRFGSRASQLRRSGRSPRNAADPINALLNYGYALAEAEARLAILAVGLDPGLGIVHTDIRNRDSLALDLLEPLRPVVERHMLPDRDPASHAQRIPRNKARSLPPPSAA